MRMLKAIWIFYRKLIVPSSILAGLLGYMGLFLLGGSFFKNAGWMHKRNKKQE